MHAALDMNLQNSEWWIIFMELTSVISVQLSTKVIHLSKIGLGNFLRILWCSLGSSNTFDLLSFDIAVSHCCKKSERDFKALPSPTLTTGHLSVLSLFKVARIILLPYLSTSVFLTDM